MALTLSQFEQIDGLMASLLRMGEFETCADPRGYIRAENRLFGALVDAFGYAYVNDFASTLECAALIVTQALLCQIKVLDEEAI
jgi:hypothetical protein